MLNQIGESIGKFLRIDSNTAMEARGKYARLCIQIDINKPLVNHILIGRLEQAVYYEGIQSLCFSCGRLGHKVEACPYTIRKGKEKEAPNEEVLPRRGDPPHEAHVGHRAQSNNTMADVGETKEVDGQYRPWMVVSKRTNGHRGTKAFVNTKSTSNSARNVAPQQPPKFSEWRGTSTSGPAFAQSMPHKDRLHGAGDHSRRSEPSWTPIVACLGSTDIRDSSNLGPLGSLVLTKGAEACDIGIGPLPNSFSLAQPYRSNPLSVKGKKVLARGFSQSKLPNTDRSSLRKLTSTKPTSLPPYHVSSPNRVPVDHSFKFTSSSSGEREHQSSGSES